VHENHYPGKHRKVPSESSPIEQTRIPQQSLHILYLQVVSACIKVACDVVLDCPTTVGCGSSSGNCGSLQTLSAKR